MMTDVHVPAQPSQPAERHALQYATTIAKPSRTGAAFVLAVTALGLIGLGGCFLIGVLASYVPEAFSNSSAPVVWTPGLVFFVLILYALAATCFGVGFWITIATTYRLLKSMS